MKYAKIVSVAIDGAHHNDHCVFALVSTALLACEHAPQREPTKRNKRQSKRAERSLGPGALILFSSRFARQIFSHFSPPRSLLPG